jgi:hypothetical protein
MGRRGIYEKVWWENPLVSKFEKRTGEITTMMRVDYSSGKWTTGPIDAKQSVQRLLVD